MSQIADAPLAPGWAEAKSDRTIVLILNGSTKLRPYCKIFTVPAPTEEIRQVHAPPPLEVTG